MPAVAPSSSADRRALALLLLALPLAACVRTVELVDLRTGSALRGTHALWSRTLSIALPTGETAAGTYTKLTTAELGPESLFFGVNAGELLGGHTSDRIYGHAKLAGAQGIAVEIIFVLDWLGHGHGVARTSSGEEYRVTF